MVCNIRHKRDTERKWKMQMRGGVKGIVGFLLTRNGARANHNHKIIRFFVVNSNSDIIFYTYQYLFMIYPTTKCKIKAHDNSFLCFLAAWIATCVVIIK